MRFELTQPYPYPLSYLASPPVIELLTPDRRRVIGRAERSGVTPPGYPDHPVYRLPLQAGQHYALPRHFETRFYVFDGRAFYDSEVWRAAERARQQARPLLITACSKAKSQAKQPVPAWLRYDGPLYRLIRKMKRAGDWPEDELTWFILSARYGLITPAVYLPGYDQPMTGSRAAAWRPLVTMTLAPYLASATAIYIDLGQTYRAALPEKMPAHTRYASGAPGQRLAALRRWLTEVGIIKPAS